MNKLSACLIVKNEASVLSRCLESIRTFVDEIVVVDTGSNDRTIEIALSYGARVYHFTWMDDFSAARNESLRYAGGEWILYIDADEVIDAVNAAKIRQVITRENIMAVTVRQCIPQQADNIATSYYSEYCRIFRQHPDMHFEGAIHEQILPSIERLGGKVLRSDIVVHHWAYAIDAVKKQKRAERNLRCLLAEIKRVPDNPFLYLNLGMTYRELGQRDASVKALHRTLSKDGGDMKRELVGQAHLTLAKIYFEDGNTTKVAYHAQQASVFDPANPLPDYLQATLAVNEQQYEKAIRHLESAIRISKGDGGQLPSVELNMAHVYLELGSCRSVIGDLQGAEEDFLRSLLCNPSSATPCLLLGNGRFLRGDRKGAREMFERAIAIDPSLDDARHGLALCHNSEELQNS